MGATDILLMGLIVAGAVYLLYHSVWKKKGHCAGCSSGSCSVSKTPADHSCISEKASGKQ